MDEIVVRVTRVLASQPRLRLLVLLAQGEQTPTQLARTLAMSLGTVSKHLQALVFAGLIIRRKSGTWCFFHAASAYGAATFSGRLAAWLRRLLPPPGTDGQQAGSAKGRPASVDPSTELFRTIFEASTAFTDLRRLQVLRYLERHPDATAQALTESLRMSPPALHRHMQKLIRRGYVQTQLAGHALVYRLQPAAKTPTHKHLFDIVRDTWT
jgi:DNA-binding MarR family transcriptional regulator